LIFNLVIKETTLMDFESIFEYRQQNYARIETNIHLWTDKETSGIADVKFKERLRDFCLLQSMYCGEVIRVVRDLGGVVPSNASSVIDTSRTPNQVSWWMTQSFQKSLTENPGGKIYLFKDSSIILLFDTHCKSICKFDWADTVLLTEKRFFSKIQDCLFYKSPLIFQKMGNYQVYHNKKSYDVNNIEIAIFIWLYLLRLDGWKFQTLYSSWNLESLESVYDIFFNGCSPEDEFKDRQRQNIEDERSNRGICVIPI
jgi:hypothetical protein